MGLYFRGGCKPNSKRAGGQLHVTHSPTPGIGSRSLLCSLLSLSGMAEALGIAGAIIATVQSSEQIASACRQYYSTVKDARKDIIHVITVISDLKGVLDNVRVLLDTDKNEESATLPMLSSLEESVLTCKSDLQLTVHYEPPVPSKKPPRKPQKRSRICRLTERRNLVPLASWNRRCR